MSFKNKLGYEFYPGWNAFSLNIRLQILIDTKNLILARIFFSFKYTIKYSDYILYFNYILKTEREVCMGTIHKALRPIFIYLYFLPQFHTKISANSTSPSFKKVGNDFFQIQADLVYTHFLAIVAFARAIWKSHLVSSIVLLYLSTKSYGTQSNLLL